MVTPPHRPFILTATPGGPGGPREPLGPGRPWRKDIRVITDKVHLRDPEQPPVPSRHSLQPPSSQIRPHFPQTQPLAFQTQASLTPTASRQAHLCPQPSPPSNTFFPLGAGHTLTGSPLGPGGPCTPGSPWSPFSPASPGGPMRPINPMWPWRTQEACGEGRKRGAGRFSS